MKKKGVYFNHGEDKLFWIESVEEREDFLFIELHYVKYNKKLDIFDVNNKKTVNIKEKNQGDKEKQHIVIKVFDDKNKAILVMESLHSGLKYKKIEELFKSELSKFIKLKLSNTNIIHSDIILSINSIIDKDFLGNIDKLKKGVSLIKLIFTDNKFIDEDLIFIGENSERRYEFTQKPTLRQRFKCDQVKSFCQEVLTNKNKDIKSIIIEGDDNDGHPIKLDKDGIKMRDILDVQLDSNTNTVDTNKIFDMIFDKINKRYGDLDLITNLIIRE